MEVRLNLAFPEFCIYKGRSTLVPIVPKITKWRHFCEKSRQIERSSVSTNFHEFFRDFFMKNLIKMKGVLYYVA